MEVIAKKNIKQADRQIYHVWLKKIFRMGPACQYIFIYIYIYISKSEDSSKKYRWIKIKKYTHKPAT